MKTSMRGRWSSELGQAMLFMAIGIPVLLVAVGITVDAGICYVTKAKLSAAVDGACLAGMKSLQNGQTTASSVASDVFYANYGANAPTPTITFPTDGSGNQQVKVVATSNVHTLFMQVLSPQSTIPVSATAVATRGKLIMSIVLDRSGSMCGGSVTCKHGESGDQGGQALQAAVPSFVNNFDQTPSTGDQVGMVSFSSNTTIDYAINYSFKTPITSKIGSMDFEGGTFGTGAGSQSLLSTTIGPPLSIAGQQNDGVSIPSGQNVVKVIVYFTDGLMNTIQDKFHCGGTTNNTLTLLNYGGQDSPGAGTYGVIFDPTQPYGIYGQANSSGMPYDSKGDTCIGSDGKNVKTFPSQLTGTSQSLLQTAITQEAKYRAKQTATTLRSESGHPNFIYTIGLGNQIKNDPTTQMLLKELANDPTADTYNSSQTTGQFFLVPDCPSSPATKCNNEVLQVFQTIAAKVLLRLTQ